MVETEQNPSSAQKLADDADGDWESTEAEVGEPRGVRAASVPPAAHEEGEWTANGGAAEPVDPASFRGHANAAREVDASAADRPMLLVNCALAASNAGQGDAAEREQAGLVLLEDCLANDCPGFSEQLFGAGAAFHTTLLDASSGGYFIIGHLASFSLFLYLSAWSLDGFFGPFFL